MSDRESCRVCGEKRPTDAPAGLCPACLLKAGLAAKDSKLQDVTILFGPASSSVVAAFGEAFGKIPPVLLRDADSITDPGPVIRPSSDEIPNPAERSARLQLFGEIARGGMGAVLKGRDADLGRDLAVKILLESHRDKPEMVRRFIEEAQIAGQLQHPGIVPVYELGAFGDHRPYFAMKLVKGHTLAEILANRKSLRDGLPRLLSIFESICQTMAYAHTRGVIHRDLKPSNVMVGSFGEVQVMDWGLAKVLPRGGVVDDASAGHTKEQATLISTARSGTDSDLSQAGSVMGTPAYMAPEQARGEVEEVDERADVFALGSIFCELLTGQPAFSGRNSGEILRKAARGDLAEAVARLDHANLGHDPELIALAKCCLSSERDDRPRHAGEVAERMSVYHSRVQERLRQSEIERAEEKARAEEATKRATVERQRLRLTVALAASLLGLMVLGGSAGFWVYQQRQTRLASLEATLARIQTLREQAAADGAESPSRREAIVAADLAVESLGEFTRSVHGDRLTRLRDELTSEQEEAERGQELLSVLANIRLENEKSHPALTADRLFSQAFQRFQIDPERVTATEVIRKLRRFPMPIVKGLVSNLDRWLMIRHEHNEPGSQSLHRILDVIQGLDTNLDRNKMRLLLLESDLKPFLTSLQATASQASLLDSGPEMSLILSRLLAQAGDSNTAVAILRNTVIRYPGDLWVNLELARNLEPTESIRYYTVARALNPKIGSELAFKLELNEMSRAGVEEALAVRQELSRIDPDDLLNLFWLSLMLEETGRASEANTIDHRISKHLSDAVLRTPDDAILHGRRAAISLLMQDFDIAIASFREVSRLDPNDDASCYYVGVLLGQEGRNDESVKYLREAVRLAPLEPDHHEVLASAFSQVNDRTSEIAELRESIRLEEAKSEERPPDFTRDNTSLNSSTTFVVFDELDYYTYGYFKGLWQSLHGRFIRRQNAFGTPEGRYQALANALVATGDDSGAVTAYHDAIKAYPGKIHLHEGLAKLLESQGKPEESEVEIDRVIVLLREKILSEPTDIKLSQRLATRLEQRGKVDESIAVYREAIKAQPKNTELHNGLAALLERQSKIQEAEVELDQVVLLLREQLQAKEEAGSLQQLGMTLLRRGQHQDAMVQFRRVIELDPKSSSGCNNIAWSLATNPNGKLRDGEIAVEFATKGCELTEWKDLMIIDTLAAACAESGDFEAAVKWQTKAIELSSNEREKKDLGTRLKLYQENEPFRSARTTD